MGELVPANNEDTAQADGHQEEGKGGSGGNQKVNDPVPNILKPILNFKRLDPFSCLILHDI